MKPVRLRPRAEQDLIAAADFYRRQGGAALAQRSFDAALAAFEAIQRMLGIGSLRIGQLCEVPGLRSWGVDGFPMQWFYFDAEDHLDVVRLLGDRQDIATMLIVEDAAGLLKAHASGSPRRLEDFDPAALTGRGKPKKR